MAPFLGTPETQVYSPTTSAESIHLKAQLPHTPPPELAHGSLKMGALIPDFLKMEPMVQGAWKMEPVVHDSLQREPMPLTGRLDNFKSFDMTPIVGTEFPATNVVDWMKAPNSDEMLRELAVTISQRGVVFFRGQTDLTDELQKELCHRLGQLTGKPKENYLHVHPLNNFNDDLDKNLNVITTDQSARPAEDLFRNSAERPLGPRGGWHTDIGYEPHSADYTILKLTRLPETGGDTLWASSCEVYDKISPAYRTFLETLTATFEQPRYHQTCIDKGFGLYTNARGSPANVGTSLKAHHPVVRTNPVTGWKSLFGVGTHIQKIDGLTAEESRRLHDWFLQMIVETPEVQCRFRWTNPYDTAIWDNRSLFHTANMDYAGCGLRTGHRAVGIGEEAYLDPASPTRREALDAERRAKGEVYDGKNRVPENLFAME